VVLACTVWAQMLFQLDRTIVLVALPDMQRALRLSDAGRVWVVAAYALLWGALVLVGGKVCQRIGLRTAFLAGSAIFGIASLVAGAATAAPVLLVGRAVQGMAAALLAPTNLALVSTTFPDPKGRGWAFAVLGATGGAAAAAGLMIGGLFVQMLGWRWCLWVNVPVAAVAIGMGWHGLAGTAGPVPGRVLADPTGLVLSCAGLFAITWGLTAAEQNGWSAPFTIGLLATGAVLLAGFVLRERHAREPLLPLGILVDRIRGASDLIMFFAGWAQLGALLYLTYYLQDNLGYSPIRTGVAVLPLVAALLIASAITARWLVPRLGVRTVYPLGTLLMAVGFQALALLPSAGGYYPRVLPGLIFIGTGMGCTLPPAFSAGTYGIEPAQSGLASAALNSFQQIGASFGTALLAAYATRTVAATLAGQAQTIRSATTHVLTTAAAGPTTDAGKRIAASILQRHELAAAVHAYAGGFQIVALAGYALSLLLITITTSSSSKTS
jgi:EmrB/QacA subfamily drug resistance transporter